MGEYEEVHKIGNTSVPLNFMENLYRTNGTQYCCILYMLF